jgi:hypothetical protein
VAERHHALLALHPALYDERHAAAADDDAEAGQPRVPVPRARVAAEVVRFEPTL